MATKYLYKDNDNLVKLEGVKNAATGSYVNSSSNVSSRLLTIALVESVSAQALTYVAASDGNYQGTWDQALLDSVTAGEYYIEYTVAEGGLDLKILQFCMVAERVVA